MSKPRTALLLVVPALALLTVGCGGGGGDSSQQTLPKAQLIKQGDAACKRADKTQEDEANAYIKENPDAVKTKAGEEGLLVTIALPSLQRELEDLKNLGTPSTDADEYEAVLEGMEAAIAEVEAKPLSITNSSTNPLVKPSKLAEQFGFTACNELL